MTPADLKGLAGGNWAEGRIELQAAAASSPALIATMPCDTIELAEAAAQLMLGNAALDLIMLRIVLDGDVPAAHYLLHRKAS